MPEADQRCHAGPRELGREGRVAFQGEEGPSGFRPEELERAIHVEEVPVHMRERTSGRSSLTTPISLYYAVKVVVAVFISMFRRKAVQLEEDR